MKTLTFAVGAAVGYVVGTRAGRERYEEIVDRARDLWQRPAVRQSLTAVKRTAGVVDSAPLAAPSVSGPTGGETDSMIAATTPTSTSAPTPTLAPAPASAPAQPRRRKPAAGPTAADGDAS